ncbi:hypothetical protein KIPB_016905, partial [Kipferlia bialata]
PNRLNVAVSPALDERQRVGGTRRGADIVPGPDALTGKVRDRERERETEGGEDSVEDSIEASNTSVSGVYSPRSHHLVGHQ